MKKLLVVLAALIVFVFLVAVIRETNGIAPQSGSVGITEYPAGTRLVVGISGHPNMYMMKDEKTIRAMAHAENSQNIMVIVMQSVLVGGGSLIPYGTKAVLALPAKPDAEWIVVRITDGLYAGETGFLLGACPRDTSDCSPQFHYANN